MARPRIWQPFETVKWAIHYEFTDAGDIRDRHRNVVSGHSDGDISLRLYDTARKKTFPRREILALEYFGPPPRYRCVICDKPLHCGVVHLNGNKCDFSRDNLKYEYLASSTGREHEVDCIHWAMTSNEVPPRARTVIRDDSVYGRNSMPKIKPKRPQEG